MKEFILITLTGMGSFLGIFGLLAGGSLVYQRFIHTGFWTGIIYTLATIVGLALLVGAFFVMGIVVSSTVDEFLKKPH